MDTYSINEKKRKIALKRLLKSGIKELKGFAKFCYYLTMLLKIAAVLLGLANISYVIFQSHDALDFLFLTITFFIPYAFSFLPAAVYKTTLTREYSFRTDEAITVKDNGLVYSYHDDRFGLSDSVFVYNISSDNIENIDYDETTYLITLSGSIAGDIYEDGKLKESDTFSEVSFLNIYDVDMTKLIKAN